MGGWGWLEQLGIKLISTQVVVEVEVGVELGNSLEILEAQFQNVWILWEYIHPSQLIASIRVQSWS